MLDKRTKIGIMGGTFDPPHLGHITVAQTAAEALQLDKVLFLPTGNFSYKKQSGTSAKKRFEMTKLAITDYPLFEICDIESSSEELSFTCFTLEKLHKLYPDSHLYFIVGADSLDYMDRWKNPEMIFELCTVVAVGRRGFDISKAEQLKKLYNADIVAVKMAEVNISSTEIRQLAKEDKPYASMIEPQVYDYIRKEKLYCGE